MSKWAKFWENIEGGRADNNVDFAQLVSYLERQVAQVRAALALYAGDDKDGWLRG